MKTINVDLDGVVYPWHETIARYIGENKHPEAVIHKWENGSRYAFQEPTQWDFAENWGLTDEQFNAYFRMGVADEYVWWVGLPIQYSVDTLWRLSSEGWNIRIVTNRLVHKFGHKQAITATADWLDRYNIPYWDLFFTGKSKKQDILADAYIDDNIRNLPFGDQSFLLSRLWNRHDVMVHGLKTDWEGIYNVLGRSTISENGSMVPDNTLQASPLTHTARRPEDNLVWQDTFETDIQGHPA